MRLRQLLCLSALVLMAGCVTAPSFDKTDFERVLEKARAAKCFPASTHYSIWDRNVRHVVIGEPYNLNILNQGVGGEEGTYEVVIDTFVYGSITNSRIKIHYANSPIVDPDGSFPPFPPVRSIFYLLKKNADDTFESAVGGSATCLDE